VKTSQSLSAIQMTRRSFYTYQPSNISLCVNPLLTHTSVDAYKIRSGVPVKRGTISANKNQDQNNLETETGTGNEKRNFLIERRQNILRKTNTI
jgi:hypothetical protein